MQYPLIHVKNSKGESYLLEWSKMCDAPISCMKWDPPPYSTDPRIDRVLEKGTSFVDYDGTGEEYVAWNRAGKNEECLSVDEIVGRYCR